eukprot:bmy_14640T0
MEKGRRQPQKAQCAHYKLLGSAPASVPGGVSDAREEPARHQERRGRSVGAEPPDPGPGTWPPPQPRRPRLLLSGWWRPRPRAGLSGPKKACEPVPPSYPFLRLHVLTGPTVSKLSALRRGLSTRRGRSSPTLDSPQGAGGTVGSGRADPGGSSGPRSGNGLKANTDMYQGMDVTWYLQRSCCVINENNVISDFDLKKVPNIEMRKTCANDAMPKKCKKKTVTAVDRDLGELELKDESESPNLTFWGMGSNCLLEGYCGYFFNPQEHVIKTETSFKEVLNEHQRDVKRRPEAN